MEIIRAGQYTWIVWDDELGNIGDFETLEEAESYLEGLGDGD